jgi:class 3 adenylate cyclase/tetratricopeptide (TPR) repeat protein
MRYVFGDYTLDTERYELRRAGVLVKVQPKTFEVLAYLIAQRARVVSRRELLAQLWPQQHIAETTLHSCIKAVRHAVGDSGRAQRVIHTLHGRGYRFVATVEVREQERGDGERPRNPATPLALEQQSAAVTAAPRTPSQLAAEYKPVTVLCCGVAEATALAARVGPEAMHRLMQAFFTTAQRVMQQYDGTITQFAVDGLLALFGAPVAYEDHARRAVLAALDLRQGMQEGAGGGPQPIQLCSGVHTGVVVVGGLGGAAPRLYTAVGETVHLATRLRALAPPGALLISKATQQFVPEDVQHEASGTIAAAERDAPISVYTVHCVVRWRFGVPGHGGRALSPFVGRERELAVLGDLLTQAERGRGQAVAIVGEPGVGKSRLCYEFTQAHRAHGWLILASSPVAYGKDIPYLPVIDLLKVYFQIECCDAGRTIRDKVTGKLRMVHDALEQTLPALLALLDVPVEDPQWQALDPPQRRQRTLDAVRRLLLWESQVQPLLLVVENLHWIDTETQTFLDSLVESLPTARLFLVATYRPEYYHRWGSKTYYTQLRLDPLSPRSAETLLRDLLGQDAGLEPLQRCLLDRTEGNPFFLEESIRTLVEARVLVGTPGAYRLVQATQSLQVPATVQAVLAARIDRLPQEEKHLLQTASVIGKDVPLSLLQAIAGLPAEALRRGLAHLQAVEFLYETSRFAEAAYTFKHALTHEVAYGSLLQERRRALHARIVEALEALAAERLAEEVDRLAHHALRGAAWDKACRYCRQAGARAAGHSAHREAVAYFEQALSALQHLPASREAHEQAIDLRFDLRASLLPLGEYERMLDYLREAEMLAAALDDRGRLGHVLAYLVNYFLVMGDLDRAIASGQQAQALATALGDVALEAEVNQRLGRAFYNLGDYRQATVFLKRTVASLEGKLPWERCGDERFSPVTSRSWLVRCLAERGEFAEGIVYGQQGLQMAEAVDQPFGLIHICRDVGMLYLRKGNLHQAIPLLERGLALCKVTQVPLLLPSNASILGSAYALAGRIGEALPLLDQAVEAATSMKQVNVVTLNLARLSEGYALAGDITNASNLAQRALALNCEHNERGGQAWGLRLLGEIAAQRHPPDTEGAERHYRKALALAEELGMHPLQAHCHLGLGTLYAKTGSRERVRAELTLAIDLYRAMDMRFWLPRTEAMLAQVDTP